ncbi:hypothetical protein [Ottowia testudinis]|uniref:Uncharacterized protein n=1 Tax=Ottowia testudinis TaxID=2816950 RepID=A0A975CGR0_9BURK|nr:hypothetical protein [Ottowia testudinis]QTD45486.1 hypothetical protein J1M35_00725 [Ottowia testudinis]
MKLLKTWALPLVLGVMPLAATAAPVTPAERDAIVASATQGAARELKLDATRLRLAPEQLKRQGDWAFLTAKLQNPAGQRFDYAGTSRHEAALAGGVSDLCAALLRREGAAWKLVDIAVGPTDVAWEGWPSAHRAPAELFR